MKKFLFSSFYVFLLSGFSSSYAADVNATTENNISYSGFECAEGVMAILPILGRGTDFPHFILRDIEKALKRQSKHAKLVKAKCRDEVKHKIDTKKLEVNNQEQEVLTQLEVIIPITILVDDGPQTTELNVEQVYISNNLEQPDARKTVNTLRVISQTILSR